MSSPANQGPKQPKMGMKTQTKNVSHKIFIKSVLQSLQHYESVRSTDQVVKEKSIKDKHHENFTVAAPCRPFGSQHQDLWDGRLMSVLLTSLPE